MSCKPLTVRDYELWLLARPGFELRLGSLPPRFARLRWRDALLTDPRGLLVPVLAALEKMQPGLAEDFLSMPAAQADRLRKTAADLNGYDLPDERENPALAEELRAARRAGTPDRIYRHEDLVASLAVALGCLPDRLEDLPVKQFHALQRAVDRAELSRAVTLLRLTGLFQFTTVPSRLFETKTQPTYQTIARAAAMTHRNYPFY